MKKKKDMPVIGVTPLYDVELESIWMLPGYMDAILKSGGLPIILPLTDDRLVIKNAVSKLDGVLVTGGPDVNPKYYGEEKSKYCGTTLEIRDKLELFVINEAIIQNKPIFGICRGCQIINVYFGGTLYQDLPSEHPSEIHHRMEGPNNTFEHNVIVEKDSILNNIVGNEMGVNSCHHQAVKKLGKGLTPSAYASDGIIEAFESKENKVFAVQWHPERLYDVDENNLKLFSFFVDILK